jgi:thiosulfate/3-mercaptopyruvate sulfurtransferase
MVAPDALERMLGTPALSIVDLSRRETHVATHIPGALWLDYAQIVAASPPVGGLLPAPHLLSGVLASIGVGPQSTVVACDDEGGGKAGRLLWTLDALGHAGQMAMLDGGMPAWLAEGRRGASAEQVPTSAAPYPPAVVGGVVADKAYILERLGDPGVCLLDTRTPAEFDGTNARAARGGHIPGAVNYEWTRAMDLAREQRLRPAEALLRELAALGVTPDREVIAYCHTHHRSSHTYWVLRWLGFERVRGYHGAWSDWGNDSAVPVEV